MTETALLNRIQRRLLAVKKSPRAASIEAGASSALLQNLISGKSKSIRADHLAALASVLDTTTDWLAKGVGPETFNSGDEYRSEVTRASGELLPVPVSGTLEAGSFREADEFVETEHVVLYEARDVTYPQARQLAFNVAGDSMNALVINGKPKPIHPGDKVVCIDFDDLGGRVPLQDNMVVVVERERDGGHLREWSVKQVELRDDGIDFCPRSTNKRHKPISVDFDLQADDGQTVRVLALVRGIRSEVPL